jgi:hypothetical protein
MTMNTTKTLMLAGFAALSLGVGTAMAQDGGGGSFPDYQSTAYKAARDAAVKTVRQAPANATVQSGSSDTDPMESGANHSATFILDHGLAGAGGVAG